MLPEEILHVIVKYIISNPVILESELFELHWKHSRTRLLPLSLVNHQFRRICMPFLFAYVEIRGAYGDLKKLRDWCASSKPFALSIRSIDYYCYSLEHIDILHHLLHFLTNLSQIILNDGGYLDVPLLNIISQHPVQSVVVASWKSLASSYLNQLGPCSLSKITLDSMKLLTESIEHNFVNRLQCGMQIRCLTVPPKMLVPAPNSFSNCKFTGLCELELWLSLTPEVSWLPTFIDNHPLLERIRFSITCVQWNVVPFILPFLETIVEEGLIDTVEIKAFSIARNSSTALPPSTDSLHGWHVASLWFCISKWSSGRLLDLAHSFFPQISMLSIEAPLPDTDCASMNADELMNRLCRFSSLRTVNFLYLYRNLKFGSPEPLHRLKKLVGRYYGHLGIRGSHVKADQAAECEATLIWYTSCIAQRIPTIENFLIQEHPLRGWIHVNEGGMSGTLRSFTQSEVNQLFSLYV